MKEMHLSKRHKLRCSKVPSFFVNSLTIIRSDEKEKQKKQRLLGDFGRNFHGYIRSAEICLGFLMQVYSRPGQNTSQMNQTKIRKDFEKKVKYYTLPTSHKVVNPRVKRQIDIEKRRQE